MFARQQPLPAAFAAEGHLLCQQPRELQGPVRLKEKYGWETYIPSLEFTTDNAAMIAIVGYLKYLKKDFTNHNVTAGARLKI